jgi:hypothetical protein
MEKDAIHDPDEEQQQEYPQDVGRQVRIGPGGEIEAAELEDPSDMPAHSPRLLARGPKRPARRIDLRPHDRGFDVD